MQRDVHSFFRHPGEFVFGLDFVRKGGWQVASGVLEKVNPAQVPQRCVFALHLKLGNQMLFVSVRKHV